MTLAVRHWHVGTGLNVGHRLEHKALLVSVLDGLIDAELDKD